MWIKYGSILALLVGAIVTEPISRHTRAVLCGAQLSEALSLACGSNFYVPRNIRDPSLGMLKSTVAMSFFGRHRRQHRGIVEECCHKSCSMQELLSYCGN
ncbi:hypothetical protein TNCT_630991 [Trichonephila clavata]|uniref:Insulin-like domain-containing protein n=1 Tax=Trichonephila clavata TaxID=2740835 RepID=A0A8X6J6F5_TRICU|nr:hypothetical protein TNCT_56391 [Trichonephila clavata]GFR01103.1 hypothetical protein TNCT_630991 [Trichonephila clavata]